MEHRITRIPVESSCVASVGYAEQAKILEVEFRSGAVYRYFGVPHEAHASLMQADSKGTHLNRWIRGRYAESKESPPPRAAPDPRDGGRGEAGRRPQAS